MALHLITACVGAARHHPFLACAILIAVFLASKRLFESKSAFPPNLQRVREKAGSQRFSWKTRRAYYFDCAELFKEAHDTFSRRGATCLVPGPGLKEEVILPASATRWLITQPPDKLSVHEVRIEYEQIRYSLGDEDVVRDGWQSAVTKSNLIPALELLAGPLWEEMSFAIDQQFGTNPEWTTINLNAALSSVVAHVTSRFTVGHPLCRNQKYIDSSVSIMGLSGLNAAVLAGLPAVARSFIGPLFRAWIEKYVRRLKAELGPVFDSRLRGQGSPEEHSEEKAPDMPIDLLSMMIQHASEERPDQLNLDKVARRIAISNVHAMSQTTIASINIILNIIASDAKHNTISTLRDELVAATSGAKLDAAFWTKANAASLTKADSVARETMRLDSVSNRAMVRKVMADQVKTEDGVVLPKGCTVSILSYPVHHGEEYFFENGHVFEPFRYCKAGRDVPEFHSAETASLVTTGPQFLPFGHGKTACPGRFLLDFELKMLVAYLLQNYDVRFPAEYGGTRPDNLWIAESNLPPLVRIQVRRC